MVQSQAHDLRGRSDLLDRTAEREVLERLIADLHGGRSGVLVLRGEAGIGKTALLRHVTAAAGGCRVARTGGVESEMELAFAGLHALCAPMLDRLQNLPEPQREALSTAFGLSPGPPPDRFLVGLATLSLLADAAEEQPVVCIVDDAHWLDRVSAQTLAFVARRLLAERLAFVFAMRSSVDGHDLEGLPELTVEGLPADEADELLDSALPGPLDARVKSRILNEAGGNPLALLELPRGMTPAELAGGFGLLDPGSLTSRIEQAFLQRAQALPRDTQRLLLTAAAEPVGDLGVLWRAAERLGIGADAARAAEGAGLIELGLTARFAHPLVRSAVYRAADPRDRSDVHRALADATDPALDPDRRAWHRAHATAVPDEEVAAELVRSAGRARARGGFAAAASFLQRAAELTPDPAMRVERSLAAADAKLAIADRAAASDLLAVADLGPLDELGRARLERLRAKLVFAGSRGRDAPPVLLEAAERLGPLDAAMARETYLEAVAAAMFAGRLGTGPNERDVAESARASLRGEPERATDLLLDALVTRFTAGYAAAVDPLQRALRAFEDPESSSDDAQWLWLACRLAHDLWDDDSWHALASRGVRVARETGALNLLPNALNHLAALNVHSGAFATATAQVAEIEAITTAVGLPPLKFAEVLLAAARGHESRELFDFCLRDATTRGEGSGLGAYWWLVALREIGNARYEEALVAARHAWEHEDVMYFGKTLVELIEAAVRTGRREEAASALDRLVESTQASGTAWARGVEARCRALIGDDEALYLESIERLTGGRAALERARSHLVYGEWLGRENRLDDAVGPLRIAHESFSAMGADAFAERARAALTGAGEHVQRAVSDQHEELTAHELQVARLVREGRSNPEIGAELFISPRTVEYHLSKVFRKLDVRNRKELRDALSDPSRAATLGFG